MKDSNEPFHPGDDDADLVRSTLENNLDDFQKLVEKYQYAAERWAFHHTKNMSDAESIAQEAFVEAYFRLDTLHEPQKFGSWLHSIVTNISISWFRRCRLTLSFEEISNVYSNGKLFEQYNGYEVPAPDDLLEQQEQDDLLQTAISRLPPAYQRVIMMFYFDSCSYKEIAETMDLSVSAIKSMLHRARQQLRKEMLKDEQRTKQGCYRAKHRQYI